MSYTRINQDTIFELKLNQFIDKEDDRKFRLEKYNDLVFFDGTSMNKWFNNNRMKIFTSDNKKCEIVVEQYLKYKKSHLLTYTQKLYIFESFENTLKFDSENEGIMFKDNVSMSAWFNENKEKILRDSEIVRIQYLVYNDGVINGKHIERIYSDNDYNKYKEHVKSKKR